MIQFLKRRTDLIIVSLLATIFYIILLNFIGIDVSEEVMFSTTDGNSYLEVKHWIETGEYTVYIGVRPFLYPLLISIATFVGGFKGIWILQFILWLLSVNFLYVSIVRLTERKFLGYLGAAVFVSNISLISLTLHALTEVTTTFLLSVFLLHLVSHKKKLTAIRFVHGSILILGLLTVVRPMFLLPLLGLLGLLPFIKFKSYYNKPSNIIWLGMVLLPVFIQMGILKWNYDEVGISLRSSDTVDFYLMAQTMQQEKNIEINVAREIITEMSHSERREYKLNHFGLMRTSLVKNIEDNIKGDSYLLIYRPKIENFELRKIMIDMNEKYYQIHKTFILALLIYTFFLLMKRNWDELILIWSLVVLPLYYIIASGVSFWQGDRLVVPAMVMWIAAYILIIDKFRKWITSRLKRIKMNDNAA